MKRLDIGAQITLADISPQRIFDNFRPEILEVLNDIEAIYDIPLALILNGRQEYISSANRMSSFCQLLWGREDLRQRCLSDHQGRRPQTAGELAFRPCHAGLLNLSLSLDFGPLGKGAILAGQRANWVAKEATRKLSSERMRGFVDEMRTVLAEEELAQLLSATSLLVRDTGQESPEADAQSGDLMFVRLVGGVLERYIVRRYEEERKRMIFDRGLGRILHELGNSSVYMELQAKSLQRRLGEAFKDENDSVQQAASIAAMAFEARYDCQNLLSALGFTEEVGDEAEVETWDVMDMLRELWPTFKLLAEVEGQGVTFGAAHESEDWTSVSLPRIRLVPQMIRRAIVNVFINAVKYSFRSNSVSNPKRYINFQATSRYSSDGKMSALSVSNFGIGFANREEITAARRFGIRGRFAKAERPIGSGIGLAEVDRIMRMHNGFIRIRSDPLGESPALTVVWLVFRIPSGL